MVINGFKNLLAIAAETEIEFKVAMTVQGYLMVSEYNQVIGQNSDPWYFLLNAYWKPVPSKKNACREIYMGNSVTSKFQGLAEQKNRQLSL